MLQPAGRSTPRPPPRNDAGTSRASAADTGAIRCLDCGAAVRPGEATWRCSGCVRVYPAVLGIPDFRDRAEAPVSPEVERLAEAFAGSSLADLVAMRTPNFTTTDPALREHYAGYRTRMAERGQGFYQMVRGRVEEFYDLGDTELAVAIGCGAGSSMLATARDFGHTIGVDPSLPDLILAKKAVQEAGLDGRVTLIQGYAQAMPLAAGTVDFVIAEDVLEHVIDLDGTLREIGRVLRRGGVFAGNSVNRYNMLRPEPHVKLWFLGFLPRAWQPAYVRWRRGFAGYGEDARLPSYRELRAALRNGLGPDSRIVFPGVETFGFPAALDRILRAVEKLGPAAAVALWVFPSHLVLGRASR